MTRHDTSPATMHASDQDLRAVAFLVNRLRPDWDTPGIIAALTGAPRHDLAALALAAVHAAANRPDQRTPAVIALDGPHWRIQPDPDPQPEPDHGPVCHICRRPARDHGRIPLCAGHDFIDTRTAPALCAICGTHRDHHTNTSHPWTSTSQLVTQRRKTQP